MAIGSGAEEDIPGTTDTGIIAGKAIPGPGAVGPIPPVATTGTKATGNKTTTGTTYTKPVTPKVAGFFLNVNTNFSK
jgi:hypothetical protein